MNAQALDFLSNATAIAGVTIALVGAVEISVPVMVIAAVAGAVSAASKVIASKQSSVDRRSPARPERER